jgi:hypothetical protein
LLACTQCGNALPAWAGMTRKTTCQSCGARLVVERRPGQLLILFGVFVALFVASVRLGVGGWLVVFVMLVADAVLLQRTGRVRELPHD